MPPAASTRCWPPPAARGASDVHFQPTGNGLELKYRVDGVLTPVAVFPAQLAANIIARLKVLSGLLTYHTDRPQEGRIRLPQDDVEMRVCTFPTLHGERAVVRLFGGTRRYQHLDDLGLPRRRARSPCGGCWRKPRARSSFPGRREAERRPRSTPACGRSPGRATAQGAWSRIEDPIEVAVDGVAQSQVHPPAGLDLANGLRFLMRQDPEVIMVGEIRDRTTADTAFQASLTGHLLLSTFHAGSAAETVGRLLDLGIEPYVLRSGLLAILNQRLLRRLCSCADGDRRSGRPAGPGCRAGDDAARLRCVRRDRLPGTFPLGGNAHAVAQ